jgi:hypothetical protein
VRASAQFRSPEPDVSASIPAPPAPAYSLRISRALALLVAAFAAHALVDRAARQSSPVGNPSPLIWPGSSPTLVPASERPSRRSSAAEAHVPIVTEWIVVETDAASPQQPAQQRARRDADSAGTTARVAPAVQAEPPVRRAESLTQPGGSVPPVAVPATADAVEPPAGPDDTPLVDASPASSIPAGGEGLPTPTESDQRQLVRDLLQRYVSAFERLDVDAAKAVWPTVDGKALRRAFSQLAAQHLTFESCGITIAGSGANARCRGQATFHPRVGSRPLHLSSREWTFQLARADDGWQIVDATVR